MMHETPYEFPPDRQAAYNQAVRLEWWTIAYLGSVVVLMYFTLGSSQAMKVAWLEDVLSLIPPLVFLVAARIRSWPPSDRFPYGFHRVVSIAFLVASTALLAMGVYLFFDSAVKLVTAEHPTIGSVTLFGQTFWLGWLMLPVLVYSGVPAMLIGRAKLPLARTLHDKVLHADAQMNAADWKTAAAAAIGVLGIAFGLWWADSVAAMLIALDITYDGYRNLSRSVLDLMDHKPQITDHSQAESLPARLETFLRQQTGVADANVRLRESGHLFFGDAWVVLSDQRNLVERIEEWEREAKRLDWRLEGLIIMPRSSLEPNDPSNRSSRL